MTTLDGGGARRAACRRVVYFDPETALAHGVDELESHRGCRLVFGCKTAMAEQDDEGERVNVVSGSGGAAHSLPCGIACLCWTTSRTRDAPLCVPSLRLGSPPRPRLPRGLVLPSVFASFSSSSSPPRPRLPRRGLVHPCCSTSTTTTSRVPVPVAASSALQLVVLLCRVPSRLARLRGGVRRCGRRRCGSQPRGIACLVCGSGRSCGRSRCQLGEIPGRKRDLLLTHFSFSGS